MPVRIDEVLNWIGANASESIRDFGTCASKTRVDEELTVPTGKYGDISTSAHENAYVAAQSLDGDSGACGFVPRFLYETGSGDDFCPGEECAWSEQSYGTSKASGCEKATARYTATE
jgi:hypothetical protein